MISSFSFIIFLCLSSGLGMGADQQPDEDDCCCERCPPGWTQLGDHCYIYHYAAKDWADAEKCCVSVGGNLASVHTKEQYDFIRKMIKRSAGKDLQTWIGGSDAEKEGSWLWSDGSKFDFKFWGPSEPSNYLGREHCLELNFNGHSNDIGCNTKLGYVCGKRL